MNENVFFFLKFKNDVQFLYDTISLAEALEFFRAHQFTAVPVIDQTGQYLGSVATGDFLWYVMDHGTEALDDACCRDLIRKGFMPSASINVTFEDLLDQATHQNYIPIVDDRNIFIGIVTRQALIDYVSMKEKACLRGSLRPSRNESLLLKF